MKIDQLPRQRLFFPPKPKDFVNGQFDPITHDSQGGHAVLGVTVGSDGPVSATLTAGAPFFHIGLSSYDLVLQEVDPSELPPGHHGRIFYWDRILAQRIDGGGPLAVQAGQQVILDVGVRIPNHALPPGHFSGAVNFEGVGPSPRTVALTGTYLAVDEATPIGQKWLAMGGESFFGPVVSNAESDPDGAGARQQFTNGMIYETPGRGAFFVSPIIEQKWLSATATGDYVRTAVGMPLGDTFTTAEGGQAQRFEFGVVVIRADQREFAIYGAMYADYAQFGDLSSRDTQPFLGLPTSDEQVNAYGRFQGFDGGDIFWTPALGAYEVHGEIRRHWYALGGAGSSSFLGLPITDELGAPDGVGRFNRFQSGVIYWTPDTGAHEVHGMILERWNALGAEQSYLGYPVSDEMDWTNPANGIRGRISFFQYGQIGWTAQDGAIELPEGRSFHDIVVTPAGTALGGWVDMTLWSNGGYSVHFHMHDSSRIADYDFVVRAIFTASNGMTLVAQHSAHISFGDDDYSESGFNDFIRKGWPAVRDGKFAVTKDYSATGLVGFLEDVGKFVLDLTAGAVGGAVGLVVALTAEVGQVFGNLGLGGTFGVLAGVVVFAAGGGVILAVASGVAVGAMTNALIRQRRISDAEWQFAASQVFGNSLPPADRIVLTNLSGIGGRAFTMPGVDGQIYVNLGDGFDNPTAYTNNACPSPGQLLIHELTHAWQIAHSRFLPGLFCQSFVNQTNNTVVEDVYRYGPPGPDWSAFNLEQQGAIVDQWFGGNPVTYAPHRQRMDNNDPYYRYIAGNIQAGRT